MGEVLFDRDWRFICDSIYRVNATESVEELERQALECLAVLIHSTQGTFFIAEGKQGSGLLFRRPVVVGMEARYINDFIDGDYSKDPYFLGAGAINKTETFRDSDLMPEEYRMNTSLYREIYQKQGIHYGLRSYLVHDGKIIGNISIFNAREKGDFTVKDVTILDTLAPHIALQLARLLEEEREGKVISGPYLDLTRRFGLTVRESEVVSKVASGKGDREIAGDLCISVSTVKKHLHNIYQKTGVSSRTQLLALLHGLPGGGGIKAVSHAVGSAGVRRPIG